MSHPSTAAPYVEELVPGKEHEIATFLQRIPRGEYLFLKEDLAKPDVIHAWSRGGGQVFVASLGDELAGLIAVVPGLGWSSHVGELRMVVDPAKRGQGVGAALARQGLVAAVAAGLEKVSVDVLADQEAVAALFRGLGFTPEALLADQVRDDRGQLHDLLVLSHPVEETWAALSALSLDESGVDG